MSSDLSNFYGAAAQTIPVLLLTLAVETSFLAGAFRSKRVEQAAASGTWVDVLEPYIPIDLSGLLLRGFVYLARPLAKALAKPLGVAANATFVFGSLLAAVLAEAAAFVGLAFDPKGIARIILVIAILTGVGLLLIETFVALILVVITGGQSYGVLPVIVPQLELARRVMPRLRWVATRPQLAEKERTPAASVYALRAEELESLAVPQRYSHRPPQCSPSGEWSGRAVWCASRD